jgi:tetratricopeptide (TPR) repeat protein
LIAIHCLRANNIDIALRLLQSIAIEGPKENRNHHFAYVRSLVEMAEIVASRGEFTQAEQWISTALLHFPESMNYMMSRIHLQVYMAYYQFQAGKKEAAMIQMANICQQAKERFTSMLREDAYSLVTPGLSYAYHQWALFYAAEGEWEQAFVKYKEWFPYAVDIDEQKLTKAEWLLHNQGAEKAFAYLIKVFPSNEEEER